MFCFLESCSTIVTIRFVNIGFSFTFGKIFTSCTHVLHIHLLKNFPVLVTIAIFCLLIWAPSLFSCVYLSTYCIGP